ncbi:MAG: pilus assembly protein PilM [Clostridiaceae bacterium]|jgi:Tfp pilus assembly PilM family ATPase|nr:pilus assembly protein PilM [Clostridiaceae bacterium]
MDFLIKKNIIKKSKVIVDIGSKYIKILEVHYAGKKVTITNAQKIDSTTMFQDDINYTDIAQAVSEVVNTNKKHEVSVSLPAHLVESKIVTVKNKKQTDIPKLMEKEYSAMGRVSPLTHILDYAYLGKKEENSDTVHYCLISAVHKNTMEQLVEGFEKYGLKITTVTFPTYNMICLSSLYYNDYENLNRLMIDFGNSGTRVVAFSGGIPVYARNLDIGFQTYVEKLGAKQNLVGTPDIIKALTNAGEMSLLENQQTQQYFNQLDKGVYYESIDHVSSRLIGELERIIELCEHNGIGITKIIYGGSVINGFDKRLKHLGFEVEKFDLDMCDDMQAKDFLLWIEEISVGSLYYNALGLAVSTML